MLTDHRWAVQQQVWMRTEPDQTSVHTLWGYRVDDPYAVYVEFAGMNRWALSREMVDRGLHMPVGLGDVQLWRTGIDRLFVALESPQGRCVVSVPCEPVRRFLRRAFAWVPRGDEPDFLGLDGVLAQLMDGGT